MLATISPAACRHFSPLKVMYEVGSLATRAVQLSLSMTQKGVMAPNNDNRNLFVPRMN
jgi:hypothetical protein